MKSNAAVHSRQKTRLVVYAGLMIAVSVVLKIVFEVYIPLGGFPSLRINLTALPIILSGILLGPWTGFVVGVISDLLCFVIKPGGPWFIGFTISAGLSGLIPGYLWRLFRGRSFKGMKWMNLGFVLIAMGILFATGLFSIENGALHYMGETLHLVVLTLFATLLILFAVYPFVAGKFMKKSDAEFSEDLLIIVTFEQVINSIILNTWFLTILYGQAWMILLPGRVITNIFLIPLYTLILSVLLKVIPKKYHICGLQTKCAHQV